MERGRYLQLYSDVSPAQRAKRLKDFEAFAFYAWLAEAEWNGGYLWPQGRVMGRSRGDRQIGHS